MSFLEDLHGEQEAKDIRQKEPSEPDRSDSVPDIHQFLTETKDYSENPDLTIYDGVPRFAHKTTTAVHDAAELDCTKVIICKNHTLAAETVEDKITTGDYAVGNDSVVHVQGKERAKCTCDEGLQGREFYKVKNEIKNQLHRHENGLNPDVFDGTGACPYHSCLWATEKTEWIVTVPQMWTRIKDKIPDNHAVIVDEEDTMRHYFPKAGGLLKLNCPPDDLPEAVPNYGFERQDYAFSQTGIDFVRQTVQNKMDEYDRVPKRFPLIMDALDAFEDLKEIIEESLYTVRDYDEDEEVIHHFHDIDVPSVDMSDYEDYHIQDAFKYLRNGLSRSHVANKLEAVLCSPRIVAQRSGDHITARIVSDPLEDFMYSRELFSEAEHVWFIGNRMAKFTAAHFHPAPDECYQELEPKIPAKELHLVALSSEDEFERRTSVTKIAKELTQKEIHNLMIAGSSRRANNVSQAIGARSYYFRKDATLKEYTDIASIDWNVTTYLGSRLTRGIDVESQITMVRSAHFATPWWDYYRPGEMKEIDDDEYNVSRSCDKMQEYENGIEVHNAMLRGAGQGETHVSVIPSNIDLFWGLDKYVTNFEHSQLEDILEFILSSLGELPDNLECPDCETRFVAQDTYWDHECINNSRRLNR